VLAPVTITFYLAYAFVNFVDEVIGGLIPEMYHPDQYLPFSIPGLGLVIALVGITLVGALTAGYLGRMFVRIYESVLNHTPIIKSIYSSTKQIFETVFQSQSAAFRDVVLAEYPRKGIWVMGFVTGTTRGEVQKKTGGSVKNVFIPTTPNPTSGFLVFMKESELIPLDMRVEDAFKMLISSGIVVPEEEVKNLKSSAAKTTKRTKKSSPLKKKS